MAGPFDFLHIKGRTAGSSNELSFDVLDAARHDLDERRRANRAARTSAASDPSFGSYTGVAGTSTLSAVPEVERRKRARRARTVRIRVVTAVAVAVLLGVGGYAGYRFYQDKVEFTGSFSALVARFVEVDKTLVQVDGLMGDPLNSIEREDRDEVLKSFDGLESELEAIKEAAQQAESGSFPADRASLAEVANAAQAREDMLHAAADAFKLSDIANRQAEDANEAWSKVLAGDAAAREAAGLANAAKTEEATVSAREKTEEAAASFTSARAQLSAVEQGLRGADFTVERAYVDQRLAALDAALATSDALLAGDRVGAMAANDAYNAAERAAADLAADMTESLAEKVKALYADEIAQKDVAYSTARVAATTADAALRGMVDVGRQTSQP